MATSIHPTAVLYQNVLLGTDVVISEYVLVGVAPRGAEVGSLATTIGDGAVIRSHTVIYAGNVIGARLQTGHGAMIRESSRIGDDVSIGSHAVIEHHVEMGNGVRIHSGAFIPEYSILEDEAWVGPNAVFTNALHPCCPKAKECLRGPRVRRGAKIGANCTLLPDIEIGEFALVGAGCVVTCDVPPHAVVTGNPARVLKSVEELNCPYGLIESPYADALSRRITE
ncbi:MAG: DapH/DapD/GlmU-related protein [Anaerolineae bacterium]